MPRWLEWGMVGPQQMLAILDYSSSPQHVIYWKPRVCALLPISYENVSEPLFLNPLNIYMTSAFNLKSEGRMNSSIQIVRHKLFSMNYTYSGTVVYTTCLGSLRQWNHWNLGTPG